MQKYEKVREEVEIKFIALPTVQNLMDSNGYDALRPDSREAAISRYKQATRQIYFAQRKCAVIAAEILRPGELHEAKMIRRSKVEQAQREYQDAALAVFSETCTKGL